VLAPTSLLAAVVMLIGAVLPTNGEVLTNPITWAFTIGLLSAILPLLFIVLNHRTTSAQINAEHISERMGQLVLIVLGESFVSLIFSLNGLSQIPNPWYFMLDFVVVLAIWTLYFTGVLPAGVPTTAGRLRAWLGLHVIVIFGAIATAGGFAALTLIPFGTASSAQAFWTPLPLFYVMIGLFGLSLFTRRPRAVRIVDGLIATLLAALSALALWVIPGDARWLTLVAAALVIGDAAVSAVGSRRQATN
jgi:low temperature requirement protein LtrA